MIPWLSSPDWAMPALILLSVWGVGPAIVIFLAGLQDVPTTLYEAARLDGASPLQLVLHVTIPLVSPVILFNGILGMINASQVFALPLIMTGGGPGTKTYTNSFYLYTVGFTQFHLSEATAGAWIFLILTLIVITFLVRRLLRAEPT